MINEGGRMCKREFTNFRKPQCRKSENRPDTGGLQRAVGFGSLRCTVLRFLHEREQKHWNCIKTQKIRLFSDVRFLEAIQHPSGIEKSS
jgi:hypothetical protein